MFKTSKPEPKPVEQPMSSLTPPSPPPLQPMPSPSAAAGAVRSSAPSIISANLHVMGNLVSEGDIQIDGTIDGDIRSTTVTIGQSAVVRGQVVAETITVQGRVEGAIVARTVILGKSARVEGDIYQEILSIEAGAHFEGMCQKLAKAQQAAGPKPALTVDKPKAAEIDIPAGDGADDAKQRLHG